MRENTYSRTVPVVADGWVAARIRTRVGTSAATLVASHAVSFRRDYVGTREYARTTPKELMSEPYRRVVVLHRTVVLGAFAVASVDNPVGALAVMVVVKTALDLRGLRREHRPDRRRLPV